METLNLNTIISQYPSHHQFNLFGYAQSVEAIPTPERLKKSIC